MKYTQLSIGSTKHSDGGHIGIDFFAYDGSPALFIYDPKTKQRVMMATIVIVEGMWSLEENQVFLKDYSENEGLLEAMRRAGLIEITGMAFTSGFVDVDIVEIKSPLKELIAIARNDRAELREAA